MFRVQHGEKQSWPKVMLQQPNCCILYWPSFVHSPLRTCNIDEPHELIFGPLVLPYTTSFGRSLKVAEFLYKARCNSEKPWRENTREWKRT